MNISVDADANDLFDQKAQAYHSFTTKFQTKIRIYGRFQQPSHFPNVPLNYTKRDRIDKRTQYLVGDENYHRQLPFITSDGTQNDNFGSQIPRFKISMSNIFRNFNKGVTVIALHGLLPYFTITLLIFVNDQMWHQLLPIEF